MSWFFAPKSVPFVSTLEHELNNNGHLEASLVRQRGLIWLFLHFELLLQLTSFSRLKSLFFRGESAFLEVSSSATECPPISPRFTKKVSLACPPENRLAQRIFFRRTSILSHFYSLSTSLNAIWGAQWIFPNPNSSNYAWTQSLT